MRDLDYTCWRNAGMSPGYASATTPLTGEPDAVAYLMDDDALAQQARTMAIRVALWPCSVEDIARLMNIEATRLERIFSMAFGIDLNSWIAATRFKMAQRMLVESSLGLSEIAAHIGFSHPAQFALEFREHVGMSPWAFRQLPYCEYIDLIQHSDL